MKIAIPLVKKSHSEQESLAFFVDDFDISLESTRSSSTSSSDEEFLLSPPSRKSESRSPTQERQKSVSSRDFLSEILAPKDETSRQGTVVLIGENHSQSEIREILVANMPALQKHKCRIMLEGVPERLNPLLKIIALKGCVSAQDQKTILHESTKVVHEDFSFIALAASYGIQVYGCETHETDLQLPEVKQSSGRFRGLFSPPKFRLSDISAEKYHDFMMNKRMEVGNNLWSKQLAALRTDDQPIIAIVGREHAVGNKEGLQSMQLQLGKNCVSVNHNYKYSAPTTVVMEQSTFTAADDKSCQGIFDFELTSSQQTVIREEMASLKDPDEQRKLIIDQLIYIISKKQLSTADGYGKVFENPFIKVKIISILSILIKDKDMCDKIYQKMADQLSKDSPKPESNGLNIKLLAAILDQAIDSQLEQTLLLNPR